MKLALVLASVAAASAHVHVGEEGSRTCGTDHDDFEIMASEMVAQNFVKRICAHEELQHLRPCLSNEERAKLAPVNVPVWYHVIHAGSRGRLTAAQVQAQFDQTNKDMAGQENPGSGAANMDITFTLAGTTYTDNAQWHGDGDRFESQFKSALAVDNRFNFNQYFTDFAGGGLLGFCYFPNSFNEGSSMHGCVNLWSSVPGGSGEYAQGKTTTHETGHGIGLFHTFQGGCNGQGDQVSDTNNQASPTNGCPASRNSCSNTGPDPIHNYMDYSFDRCMYEFTPGQNTRANQQLSTFRPSLYLGEENVALIKSIVPDAWHQAEEFQRVTAEKKMAAKRAKYGEQYGLE